MADKEITIKVNIESDVSPLDDISKGLEEIHREAEETGEALKTAFEEATEDVERLSDELAQIELGEIDGDFDAVAQQLEEAQERADALADAIDSIDTSSLDSTGDGAKQLSEDLNNANKSATELAESMGLIEGVMLLDLAKQVGSASSGLEGFAQSMDNVNITMGQLSTKTGIAEGDLRSLIGYISNATFPQEEAMAYVNALNQMGISADKLGESATNMDKINDATHIGYQSVMNLTAGLRAVGIEADNLPASFNAIAYAEANVYDGTNTLASTMKMQAGNIKEYGLNVDQLVVVLGALQSQTGLTGRKLSSELGKRLEECNGDVSALEQSLGLANGTLQNANQITGQYEGTLQRLADEEKEHKTLLEQIGAGFDDLTLQISGVLSPFASFGGMLGSVGQTMVYANATKELAITFGLLKKEQLAMIPTQIAEGIAGNFSISWMLIAIAVGLALGLMFVYLYENCDWFREGVQWLGEALMELASLISGTVMQTFDDFTKAIGINTETWSGKILAFLMFIPMLPLTIANILNEAIGHALGFGTSFTDAIYNAGVDAYNNFVDSISGMSEALQEELDAMVEDATSFEDGFPPIFQGTGLGVVGNWIIATGEHSPGKMYDALEGELTAMTTLPLTILQALLTNILHIGSLMVQYFGNSASSSVSKFMSYISTLPSKLQAELNNMLSLVSRWASTLPQKFWDAGVNAVKNFLNALGIHSPGYMQIALLGELEDTGKRIPSASSRMINNIGTAGENITNAFNPNLNVANTSIGNPNTFAGGDTIINIYGDVDSDKRVQEIVETIRRELSWDNATAGRTV